MISHGPPNRPYVFPALSMYMSTRTYLENVGAALQGFDMGLWDLPGFSRENHSNFWVGTADVGRKNP